MTLYNSRMTRAMNQQINNVLAIMQQPVTQFVGGCMGFGSIKNK